MKKFLFLFIISLGFSYANSDLEKMLQESQITLNGYLTDEHDSSGSVETSFSAKLPIYKDSDKYLYLLESEEKKLADLFDKKKQSYQIYMFSKRALETEINFLKYDLYKIKVQKSEKLLSLSQNNVISSIDKSLYDENVSNNVHLEYFSSKIKGKKRSKKTKIRKLDLDTFLSNLIEVKELTLKNRIDSYKIYSQMTKHEFSAVASHKLREATNNYSKIGFEYKFIPYKFEKSLAKARLIASNFKDKKDLIMLENSLFFININKKIEELDKKIESLYESSSWEYSQEDYKKEITDFENKIQKAEIEILKIEKKLLLLELYKKVLRK